MDIFSKVLVALSLLLTTPVFAQIDLKNTKLADFAGSESLTLNGFTSVIVEFNTPGISTSALTRLDDASVRSSMKSARSLFESSMSAATLDRVTSSFNYYPGVVMELDSKTLDELKQNPLVAGIYQNRLNRAFLRESRQIVHPNNASSKVLGDGWAVAVLDTGTDSDHVFLNPNGVRKVVSEACYSGLGIRDGRIERLCPGNAEATTSVNSGRNCTGYDGCDHGTHVSGIAAGQSAEFGGIASNANIIAMQVFTGLRNLTGRDRDLCGGDSRCILSANSDLIRAMERVFDLRNSFRIASVNFSLGGGRFTDQCAGSNPAFAGTVARLKSAGIAVVAATGNDGFNDAVTFPACLPDVIAVGATSDFTGTRFGRSFELDQRVFYSNSHPLMDVFAPGSAIVSSVPGNGFATFDGTSMASPHVAGAFAILKQAKPSASVDEIEAILKMVGPDVAAPDGISRKRLDLRAALQELGFGAVNIVPVLDMLLSE